MDATRQLMRTVATTDVGIVEMEGAARRILDIADDLTARRRRRHRRLPFDEARRLRIQAGEPWEHFSFNPLGIPFEMHVRGGSARATVDLDALHEGPPERLHGGFGAALLDAFLGSLVMVQGTRSVTATLDLRYLAATPLDTSVTLAGEVVRTSGRKTWAEGWIEHGGRRTVEATGLFVRMPGEPD